MSAFMAWTFRFETMHAACRQAAWLMALLLEAPPKVKQSAALLTGKIIP
jgi:hypothetical protein